MGLRAPNSTSSDAAAPSAWTTPELSDPHSAPQKGLKVQKMFGAIAGSYDLNNRLHSMWQDQRWRRAAVRAAEIKPGESILDVACGTGDLTQLFAKTAAARVVGLDFTPEMLEVARQKQARLATATRSKIQYLQGDAMHLPFPDRSFDAVSIAFGIRNVTEPAKALAEFSRVLRPGGRLVVLEFLVRNPGTG